MDLLKDRVREGLKEAHIFVKIAAVIGLLAQIFSWIAFCSASWYVIGDVIAIGLWRNCEQLTGSSCVTLGGRVGAAQAFAVFAYIALNAGFFLIPLYMFYAKLRGNKTVGLASAAALIFSAVSWLLAVVILAAYVNDISFNIEFGSSFALAIVALILALAAGILMLMAILKGGSVGAK